VGLYRALLENIWLDWVVGPKQIIAEISTGSMKDGTFSTRDS
jgi:hypothetical protein